jgi:hypothetical protein
MVNGSGTRKGPLLGRAVARLSVPRSIRDEVLDEISDLGELRRARGARSGAFWYLGQVIAYAVWCGTSDSARSRY